ncbi:hypothetical protein [Corallococcus sp. CA053C]|uniref:hypothetical protein n=1 Tax=Corallococcus sp. CA053C TaxID=2316732 RepID=UPI001315538F|nr:hypothetical protein [Corallococcus sp. CA053C]
MHIRGSGAEAEVVTSVEPTAELPVFISFPGDVFNPKAGDVLGLMPKPGDEFPAFLA